jgi:hypothetical protein
MPFFGCAGRGRRGDGADTTSTFFTFSSLSFFSLLGTSSDPAGNDDDFSTATMSVDVAPSDFAVAGFSSSADAATMLSAITQVAGVIQMCTDHWIASYKRYHENVVLQRREDESVGFLVMASRRVAECD